MITTSIADARPSRRRILAAGVASLAGILVPSFVLEGRQPPPPEGPADPRLIEDLVAANRILAKEGILDVYGHISARHNSVPDRFLLARSVAPELVTAADVIEYDLESNPLNPASRASYSERFIHGEIYKARPDVKAIVHCHTPSIIPFGASAVPLRPMYHMGSFIAEGVPVFDIRDAAGLTDMLVRDGRLGRALAQVLADKPAALMRGHGAVVVGNSIPRVVGRSVYLDANARLQAQAIALGGSITYLDPEEARQWDRANGAYDRAWDLWKRQVAAR